MHQQHIDIRLKVIADEVRDYVRLQAKTWQQIPFWALQADGCPWWGITSAIYTTGLCRPNEHSFIECASGKVLMRVNDRWHLATDVAVVQLLERPARIDAANLLGQLKTRALTHYSLLDGTERQQNNTLREQIQTSYAIERFHTRRAAA